MSESELSKQEQVVNMVKEGKYTRKEIIEAVACTSGAFASYLSGMRNAAKFTGAPICPVEIDVEIDGVAKKVFVAKSVEEVEEIKASRGGATSKPKNPKEALDMASKKLSKAVKAAKNAQERANKDKKDVLNKYKAQAADIAQKIAQFEFDAATTVWEALTDEERAACMPAEPPQEEALV